MSVYDHIGRCDWESQNVFIRGMIVPKDFDEMEDEEDEEQDLYMEVKEKLASDYDIHVPSSYGEDDVVFAVVDIVLQDSQEGDIVLRDNNIVTGGKVFIDWTGATNCNPVYAILEILRDIGILEFARIDYVTDYWGADSASEMEKWQTEKEFAIICMRYEYDDEYDNEVREIDLTVI